MTSWRRDRMVFVDPQDPAFTYWWPALIVPYEELSVFRSTLDDSVGDLKETEQLVVYFEDGSFSIVRDQDLLPFCPAEEPYQSYIHAPFAKQFLSDKAVILASRYWESGCVPDTFKWLVELYSDVKIIDSTTGEPIAYTTAADHAAAGGKSRKKMAFSFAHDQFPLSSDIPQDWSSVPRRGSQELSAPDESSQVRENIIYAPNTIATRANNAKSEKKRIKLEADVDSETLQLEQNSNVEINEAAVNTDDVEIKNDSIEEKADLLEFNSIADIQPENADQDGQLMLSLLESAESAEGHELDLLGDVALQAHSLLKEDAGVSIQKE